MLIVSIISGAALSKNFWVLRVSALSDEELKRPLDQCPSCCSTSITWRKGRCRLEVEHGSIWTKNSYRLDSPSVIMDDFRFQSRSMYFIRGNRPSCPNLAICFGAMLPGSIVLEKFFYTMSKQTRSWMKFVIGWTTPITVPNPPHRILIVAKGTSALQGKEFFS